MRNILLFIYVIAVLSASVMFASPIRSSIGSSAIKYTSDASKPYDAEIEYAHFPSGCYIDTGIQSCSAFGSQFTFRINRFVGSYDTYYGAYSGGGLIGMRRHAATNDIEMAGYAVTIRVPAIIGDVYVVEVNPEWGKYQWVYLNGDPVKYVTSVSYKLSQLTLFIGGAHHANPIHYYATSDFDFFGFKVWDYRETPSLIMDLIPVRIGEDAFVYDKVSKQFFSSLGTAKLGLGPDKR